MCVCFGKGLFLFARVFIYKRWVGACGVVWYVVERAKSGEKRERKKLRLASSILTPLLPLQEGLYVLLPVLLIELARGQPSFYFIQFFSWGSDVCSRRKNIARETLFPSFLLLSDFRPFFRWRISSYTKWFPAGTSHFLFLLPSTS